ncbi:MAG: TrkH family potassium uptake protein [Phycisphaerae bacterium]
MPESQSLRAARPFGPTRAVAAFAVLILVGTAVLALPFAARGERLSLVDALFTATSGVCVTGLSTISIGERLSTSGQAILLALIQLGGLGITTVSTILLLAAGRATLGHTVGAEETLAAVRVKPLRLLWWVALATVVTEAVGALILWTRLSGPNAAWTAVFHSVSAFCNAGFSLYTASLTASRSDPVVLGTISVLIMSGGLGFIVLRQVSQWLRGLVTGKRSPLFLHSRVVLLANLALWVLGAALLFVLERDNAFADHAFAESVLGAIFQSISSRTAGFNTIDFATLREPTLFAIMFLMLIGASPGSCGGGLKVTTAAVIIATIVARLRGAETVGLLRRSVPAATVQRSFLLLSLALLFLTVVVAGLLFSEEASAAFGRADRLTVLSFEAVSALGTVGFSTGVTPTLSPTGKLLIIACMFIGRLGPLVVALAIVRPRAGPKYSYPQEEIAIG